MSILRSLAFFIYIVITNNLTGCPVLWTAIQDINITDGLANIIFIQI